MHRRWFIRTAAVAVVSVPVLRFPFAAMAAPRLAPTPSTNVLHVSTAGYDQAMGTADAPLRTLRELTRRLRRSLPVELVSFEGVVDGTRALLTWATASETNNAGFHVEREVVEGWVDAAFVAGHGTTVEGQRYRLTLDGLASGRQRFRLRQVDYSGQASYSSVVEVLVAGGGVRIGPNPARGVFRVEGLEPGQPVVLCDALGRRVWALVPEGAAVTIDGAAFAPGTYFLRTSTGTHPVRLL